MPPALYKSTLFNTETDINNYILEPIRSKYWNWEKRKLFMIKNLLSKFVYDEIGIIITNEYHFLNDGRNTDFCIFFVKDQLERQDWIRWWISFSRFLAVGIRGLGLESIDVKDYNYLRQGITLKLLHIASLEWDGIESYIQDAITLRKSFFKSLDILAPSSLVPTEPASSSKTEPENQTPMTIQRPSTPISTSLIQHIPQTLIDDKSLSSGSSLQYDSGSNIQEKFILNDSYIYSHPPPAPHYLLSEPFSVKTLSESKYPDMLNQSRFWSFSHSTSESLTPSTQPPGSQMNELQNVIQNQNTLSRFQGQVELSIYMKSHDLKLVKQ
ncbi:hypothetical protein L873DRAFT_1805707 [Choiromyces venosus 120613-1]|uniref:Uncharacterized protein n=1 Tax=Choiromyces venosus 120613-1 TaxID=1336337 RepID=A0A3N4JPX7_9PEZI|nr:hypothetical protein L873DRAFT_1805707 [Choiromyces venosus 120613-1]